MSPQWLRVALGSLLLGSAAFVIGLAAADSAPGLLRPAARACAGLALLFAAVVLPRFRGRS